MEWDLRGQGCAWPGCKEKADTWIVTTVDTVDGKFDVSLAICLMHEDMVKEKRKAKVKKQNGNES